MRGTKREREWKGWKGKEGERKRDWKERGGRKTEERRIGSGNGGWWVGCAWTREIREIMVARIRAPLVHTRPHAPGETDRRTVPMGPARHSAGNSLDNNHLLFLNGVDALPEPG